MSFLKNKHYNKASLILVTYNNYKLLVKALESIYTYTPHNLFHLYIIDNNSTDKTASLHAKKLVNTTLIKNNKNLYWAGGINQGILLSQDKYKYIFFLNDDIEVYSNWLQNHISVLDKYPDVGVVGPLDSSINSGQGYVNIKKHLYPKLPGFNLEKRFDLKYVNDLFRNQSYISVSGTLGFFCVGFRSEVVKKIGLLDERFIMSADDDDYIIRLQEQNYKLYLLLNTYVIHYGGLARSKIDNNFRMQCIKNSFKLLKQKHSSYNM